MTTTIFPILNVCMCVFLLVCFRKHPEKSPPCGTGNEDLQKDCQYLFLQLEKEEGITEGTTRDELTNAQAQNGMSNQMGIHEDDDSTDP